MNTQFSRTKPRPTPKEEYHIRCEILKSRGMDSAIATDWRIDALLTDLIDIEHSDQREIFHEEI